MSFVHSRRFRRSPAVVDLASDKPVPPGWLDSPTAVVVLLAVFFLLTVTSIRHKSPGFDEVAHVTGGYSVWITNDYRLHPANGILPQRWATIPLLFGSHVFPSLTQEAWWKSKLWEMGHQFLYSVGNDHEAMFFRARVMMAFLGVALCLLIYVWSRSLYGPRGGIISLFLAAWSPALLAQAGLVTSDMAMTLFLTLSVGMFWRMLHHPSLLSVLASAFAMGALFVSKMSAVLFLGMALLMVIGRIVSGIPWSLYLGRRRLELDRRRGICLLIAAGVVHVLVVVLVVWASFGFRYGAFQKAEPGLDQFQVEWQKLEENAGPVPLAVGFARRHRLLPEAYLYGLTVITHSSQARAAFLNGAWSAVGWPGFFPYCFLVKTPLMMFLILGLAGWGSLAAGRGDGARLHWRSRYQGLYRTAPLWILLGVYWTAAVLSHLNIGHRHITPVYPALFVLAGSSAHWFARRHVKISRVLAMALGLYAFESGLFWPHYLASFNPIAGGPKHAYKHLVDSSLDWGMDLPELKRWLDRNAPHGPDRPAVYLSYFGSADPTYYQLDAWQLPGYLDLWRPRLAFSLTGGLYCISATMLQMVYLDEARGPWALPYEKSWQEVQPLYRRFQEAMLSPDPEAQGRLLDEADASYWNEICQRYESLRLGRLCAWLRKREPDDDAGHSILIYRLTDQDVDRALYGPPAELRPGITIRGLE